MDHNSLPWPAHAKRAVADVLAAIPQEWRISSHDLAMYPLGSDIRPIVETCNLLSPRELEITSIKNDATGILAQLADGKLTASETLTAFAKRTAIAHQAVSCLAGFCYERALVKARELDARYSATGRPVGPLHGMHAAYVYSRVPLMFRFLAGLPISVKSQINVTGTVSSAGFSKFAVADSDALIVRILEDAGAVVFCKTNLPQAIMQLETHSFWGLTVNPFNTSLSPGGSSGGCSALLAFGGSPASFGTDIGGSVRNPAASTGLWTLKPTTNRLPRSGMFRLNVGFDSILASVGPICRSLRDVDLFMRVIIAAEAWNIEHSLVPLPWRSGMVPSYKGTGNRIRVGIMRHDDVVRPHPPIQRGIDYLEQKLRNRPGIEIVSYNPYKHREGGDIAAALYYPDGAVRLREAAQAAQDPILPLTEWVISRPSITTIQNMADVWKLNDARETFRQEYLAHWTKTNIDVLICPASPQTAAQLGTSKYWGYTSIYNLLDFSAAVFPTGLFVDEKLDPKPASIQSMSAEDTEVAGLYSPSAYRNTPICLQAVAARYEDEKLIAILTELEQYLHMPT